MAGYITRYTLVTTAAATLLKIHHQEQLPDFELQGDDQCQKKVVCLFTQVEKNEGSIGWIFFFNV